MTQHSLSLDSHADNAGVLLVRDGDGQTRPAKRREILRVARELVDISSSLHWVIVWIAAD